MKKGKKIGIIAGVLLVAALIVTFFSFANYYKTRFQQNTVIDGVDYSGRTPEEADGMRRRQDMNYHLRILGREGSEAVLSAEQLGMTVSYSRTMSDILTEQDPYAWIGACFNGHLYTLERTVTYDPEVLAASLEGIGFLQKENMRKAQDAYIGDFDEEAGRYVITAERPGTELSMEKVLEAAGTAILNEQPEVDLDAAGCYLTADITSEDVALNAELAHLNRFQDSVINLQFGEEVETLDFSVFHDWLTYEGQDAIVDEGLLTEYLKSLAENYDTYGKKELFTTVDGYVMELPKGRYGWKLDIDTEKETLVEEILSGEETTREPAFTVRAARWGEDDIGDYYAEVDMTAQKVYVVDHGQIIFTSDCVTGNMSNGNATPPGIFGVTYRQTNAILRGDNYASFVNYWMPFNGNIGFHDATWRSRFGGDIYRTNGSHGCINMPKARARELFNMIYQNCPVICYYIDDSYIVSYPDGVTPTAAPMMAPEPTPEPVIIAEPEPTLTPEPLPTAVPVLPDETSVSDNTVPADPSLLPVLTPVPEGVVSDPSIAVPDVTQEVPLADL